MNGLLPHGLWAGSEAWSVSEAFGGSVANDLALLAASELFDAGWYLRTYADIAVSGIDPAAHFIAHGWQEGRRPNFYFDPPWYLAGNPDVARAGMNPVLHYIAVGEAEGRAPSEHFDLGWYAAGHTTDPGRCLLAHFLARRLSGLVSPLPEFDAAFYLARYPDVAAAGADPFEHYLLYGAHEERDPSSVFDTRFYVERYLDGMTSENPLLHYRRHRHALRLHTCQRSSEMEGPEVVCDLAMLTATGLFDAAWYLQEYPDAGASEADACAHFIASGWQEERRPNRYFDTAWYLHNNPGIVRSGINPVVHYVTTGEAEGRAPAEYFDLAWYATQHEPEGGRSLLAHFLDRRCTGQVSPLPEFDAAFYLARYPDVAAAGVDPFEHYLLYGFREGRDPSASFDTRYYIDRYLDGVASENPLIHYRRHRHALRLHTRPPAAETDVFEEVRRFSRPGADFEAAEPLPASAIRRAKVLAFYLPQFHPIPENDVWWGRGFTEWTAIGRGMPRFAGHYQPRLPGDLGHYRLGDTAEGRAVMRRQAAMARDAGVFGFVHYFYWFNGRRLLEAPVEAMLADRSIDFPFCLMWANENWTRRWDGSEQEVLISQDYNAADDAALVACFARHFRDPRYIRIDGRPLLMVYRAADIPDTPAAVVRWRALFADHGENPLLVMAQSFGATDPRGTGFDAAVEFPPHKLAVGLPRRNAEITLFDKQASAHVYDYDDLVRASLDEAPPPFPLLRTAVPSWDNDARRQGAGLVLRGSTPAKYQAWMTELVTRASAQPFLGEALVCVNAWNEWAEGAYLEPDVHFGAAYLNATARAVTRAAPDEAAAKLLLVGHDAFPAGAQHLLLHLLRRLRARHGVQAEYLLLGEGRLTADYAATAAGIVVADPLNSPDRLAALVANWAARGFTSAIVNTAAAAWIAPMLRDAGMAVTLLVHELPGLIEEKGLLAGARAGAKAASRVIFPAGFVRDRFTDITGIAPAAPILLPQGLYNPVAFSAQSRRRIRKTLGLGTATRLVLGAGYADLRKGFDLFLQAWRAARRRRADAMFCWIGDIDPVMRGYLGPEIAAAEATGRFRLAGYQRDVAAWLSAADAFALTSREDPYPSAVLEALAAGLHVVAFTGSGGIPELLAARQTGATVPLGDVDAMARSLLASPMPTSATRTRHGRQAAAAFGFDAYTAALLRLAQPDLAEISVVVPSYNYAGYLEHRLVSILGQTYPVAEIIVLDDASSDDSVAVARRVAADWRRDVTVIEATENSGSVFRQWQRAAATAQGEFLWIAEADDGADPILLATLAARLRAQPDAVLAFCDSRAIDAAGDEIWPSYHDYYAQSGAEALARDALFPARAFARRFLAERNLILNVSAVLWRRDALLAAIERCGEELCDYRSAGDWRLYVELLADCDGSVAYVAAALNQHRRHDHSVTRNAPAQVAEIARMHKLARQRLAPDAATRRRQGAYLQTIKQELARTRP